MPRFPGGDTLAQITRHLNHGARFEPRPPTSEPVSQTRQALSCPRLAVRLEWLSGLSPHTPGRRRAGLCPPEADGEAQVQGPHVMPVFNGDEQQLSRGQDAGQERGLREPGELLQVGILHVNLEGANKSHACLWAVGEELRGHAGPPGWCCAEGACHEGRQPPTPAGNTGGCTSSRAPGRERPASEPAVTSPPAAAPH